MLPDLLH